ncbi:MAG: hypothetical protein WKF86_01240 [Acidimicrobiales bacterium]
MLRPRRSAQDEGGVVAINLVLFLGFALYAVVRLTQTTLAAQQIDERVIVITKEVGPIDQNLNEVPKLDLTNETAAKIRTAADGLSAEAGFIIDAAKSIDGTVTDINQNAETINGTVKAISNNVNGIAGSVRSIGGNVNTLNGVVSDIRGVSGSPGRGVAGINNRVDIVIGLAQSIRGDLGNVNSVVGGSGALNFNGSKTINGHAKAICLDLGGQGCV